MAVRLAEPPICAPEARRTPHLMEKFVIDGGVPLRGTVTPAGNKNARPADPRRLGPDDRRGRRAQRPAHPRRRGDAARAARPRARTAEWRDDNEVVICAAGVDREAHVDREHAERIRASFLLAGPLLARFGRADMPPPGGDVIGRRRLDPHIDAFRALGADLRARPRHRPLAPNGGLRAGRGLHGRAVGHGDRERAHGRGADARHDDHRQRRVRAPRPGPRADAGQDGRRHPRHRLQRARSSAASTSSAAARTTSAPTTSRSAPSSPWPASPAASSRSRAPSPRTCA